MIDRLRRAASLALIALAALQAAWYLWWDPPRVISPWLALALALLPLAPSAWNAFRDAQRARLWGAIACLLYFTHGVMETWASASARVPAAIEIALALATILSLGAAAIIDKRRRRAAATVDAA